MRRISSLRLISVYIVLLAMMSMGLSGCGVKPPRLSPPAGHEDSTFPHTYPDPSTDPQ